MSSPPSLSSRFRKAMRSAFSLLSVAPMALLLAGCASETNSSTTPAGSAGAQTRQSGGDGTVAAEATTDRARDEVWVDADGRKWFGNIPYDVFFDEPYQIAASDTPAAGIAQTTTSTDPATASTPAIAEVPPTTTPPQASSSTAASDDSYTWDQLIDSQTLDDEVKSIRNFLNENLQTVGNYNSSMLMIPPKAATLAVLAAVAMEHSEDVTWREDAGYIRDLAAEMNADVLQRGAKTQRRLLGLYESLSDTLNRSRPAGLAEPQPLDSYADIAEMRLVMMRMSAAEQQMRTEAGSEGAFSSNADMVRHEAAVLGTLTHSVTLPGYGYADDPTFVGYARKIVDAARSLKVAADSNDFATYEQQLSIISTACQACHSEYKND
jgi:hypothetical protein